MKKADTVSIQSFANTSPAAKLQSNIPSMKSEEKKKLSKNLEEGKVETNKEGNHQIGKWAKEEHDKFMEAFYNFGKSWKKIQECVGTRTITQVRSHAQKCLPGATPIHRKPKDATNPEEGTRKRVRSVKMVNGIKKGKVSEESNKSAVHSEQAIGLQEDKVLINNGAAVGSIFNFVSHYPFGEIENKNYGQDFDFDISEEKIKPLDLEESKNLLKSINANGENSPELLI